MESAPTSVRPAVGRDVPEVDNVLFIEAVDEGGEALPFDVADGQHQHFYPSRGDGYEGIESHDGEGGRDMSRSSCLSRGVFRSCRGRSCRVQCVRRDR